MTPAEAFRAIAQKLLNEGKIKQGICYEIYYHTTNGDIARYQMLSRVADHKMDYRRDCPGDCNGGYVYQSSDDRMNNGGTHHEERALACLLMAEECDDEDRRGALAA